MEQNGPVGSVFQRDRVRIGQKTIDPCFHVRSVLAQVDVVPVPIQGLFLAIDDQPAMLGIKAGLVIGDPEVEGDRGIIGMGIDAGPL